MAQASINLACIHENFTPNGAADQREAVFQVHERQSLPANRDELVQNGPSVRGQLGRIFPVRGLPQIRDASRGAKAIRLRSPEGAWTAREESLRQRQF